MFIIKNGRVVDPQSQFDQVADVLVENGKILEIGQDMEVTDAQVIDATGLVVAPGLVDVHVHFSGARPDPQGRYSYGFASAVKRGDFGGYDGQYFANHLKCGNPQGRSGFSQLRKISVSILWQTTKEIKAKITILKPCWLMVQ